MELWLLIGGTILVMTASFLLGEYFQERREHDATQKTVYARVMSCARFASNCTGRLVWAGVLDSAKRKVATEVLTKAAYENSYQKADRLIEEKICIVVNELV